MQRLVDDFYAQFVADVASGRGVSVATARGPEFGEGRVLTAKRAVKAGLADRVDTLDATLARVLRAPRKPAGARAVQDQITLAAQSEASSFTPDDVEFVLTSPEPSGQDAPPSESDDEALLAQILTTVTDTTTSLKEA